MLLVPTTVKVSPIAGRGLFAAELIRKGAPWWRLDPAVDRVLTMAEIERMSPAGRAFLHLYGYKSGGIWIICGDNGRFVNHSVTPNSGTVGDYSVALRDIQAGEEITEDYRDFCEEWARHEGVLATTLQRVA